MINSVPYPHHFLGKYNFNFGSKKLIQEGNLLKFSDTGTSLLLQAYELEQVGGIVNCYFNLDGTTQYLALVNKKISTGASIYVLGLTNDINSAAIIGWQGFSSDMINPAVNPYIPLKNAWHVAPGENPEYPGKLALGLTTEGYLAYTNAEAFELTSIQKTNSWYDLNRQKKTDTKDFKYVSFNSEVLSNLDLTGVDFSKCNFQSAKLDGATLTSATMTGAYMESINMSGATITNLVLPQGNYTSANLKGLDLRDMDLGNSDFTNANLNQITFSGTVVNSNFVGADFTGATLTNTAFSNQNAKKEPFSFVKTNFSSVTLSTCSFIGCDLTSLAVNKDTVVKGVNMKNAILKNIDFSMLTNTDWGTADLSGSTIETSNLTNSNLGTVVCSPAPTLKAYFKDDKLVTRLYFAKGTVQSSFLGANWDGFDLSGATIVGTTPFVFSSKEKPLSAKNCLLNELVTDLQDADFSYADFTNAELTNVKLNLTNFSFANLSNAYLKQAKMNKAWLVGVNLTGAYLTAKATENLLDDSPVNTAAQLNGAYLLNALLDSAHFDGVSLDNSLLVSASLVTNPYSKLTNLSAKNTSFILCPMNTVYLCGSNFEGSLFNGSSMSNAILVNADLSSADLEPEQQADNKRTDLNKSDIRGTWFATESGDNPAKMQGADLTDAKTSNNDNDGLYVLNIPDPTQPMASGKKIIQHLEIRKTILGNTDASTSCPNGLNGPCKIE